jgi:parvulin-like peptidyl-prolyl isomerase
MRFTAAMLVLAAALHAAVVIDRVAVVVNKQAIKLSDIRHELRLTEFLNQQPLNLGSSSEKSAADHLIDQAVIRDEIALEGYGRATDADAQALLNEIRQKRFGGSTARLQQALERYGLTERELLDHLRWQMTVLDFIDERFRPAVLITDQQVQAYYESHLPELQKRHPRDYSFKTLEPAIRKQLEEEQINKQFDTWLQETRKAAQIRFLDGAFK